MSPSAPVLVCSDVKVGYTPESLVVKGASFAVRGGEMTAIIGPNGSGKTTLVRALAGVLPPASGEVRLDDQDVFAMRPRERARKLAVVSQRAVPLEGALVREVVLMGRYAHLSWHSLYRCEDRDAATQAMAATGVTHLAERRADTLSGGEWQRVLLARALAQGAGVLLLDEPSTGLDPGRLVELFDLLEDRRARGAAILAVLHDINLAALYAGRIIGLKNGEILFDGSPSAVFTALNLERLYDISFTVFAHPATGAPQACLLPGRGAAGCNAAPSLPGTGIGTA